MSEAQFEIDLKEEALAEDDFLRSLADAARDEFFEQEQEREARTREKLEEEIMQQERDSWV